MKNTKSKKVSVTVMIPAVNEEKIIGKTVRDCLKITAYDITPLVVLDSKTTDNTAKAAKGAGATVIHIGEGKGKGTAFRKAIPHLKGEYIVQIDADYQFQPNEIPLLVKPLLEKYDVTLGTRYQEGAKVERGSVTPLKRLGSFGLSAVTSLFAKQRITDVMAGFKGFRRDVLTSLHPKTDHFGYEAELVIRAAKKKYKIKNVPITYKSRPNGYSNVSSIKHGLLVLRTILNVGMGRD